MKNIDIVDVIAIVANLLALTIIIVAVWAIASAINQPSAWDCIEGGEDVGYARVCQVDECHVMFYGDDVLMECE